MSYRLQVKTQLLPISPVASKWSLYHTCLGSFAALSVWHLAKKCGKELGDWKNFMAARIWYPIQVKECCGLLHVHFHHLHIQPPAFAPAKFAISVTCKCHVAPPERREPTSSSTNRSLNLRRRVWPDCSQSLVPSALSPEAKSVTCKRSRISNFAAWWPGPMRLVFGSLIASKAKQMVSWTSRGSSTSRLFAATSSPAQSKALHLRAKHPATSAQPHMSATVIMASKTGGWFCLNPTES